MLTLPVGTFRIFALTVLFAYSIVIISFSLICFAAFAVFPLIKTRPMSETSFATVLRLINLETFKNLSNLMLYILSHDLILCYNFCRGDCFYMKKFLLLIISFVLVLFFNSGLRSFAGDIKTIKFVQVSDVHLSATSDYSIRVLKSAVDDINKQQGVSFVVFTGDNINNASEENLKQFLKIVKSLNVPYYIAIGDHDVYKANGLSKTRYYEMIKLSNWAMLRHNSNYKFKKQGFVFLVVDGAKEIIPGSVGYYRADTLEWLDKELTKNSKRSVVILQHFPVMYPEGAESSVKTHKTYKVEEYQKLIDKHNNVLAIISGHFHINAENMENGVYHISTPSLLMLPQAYKIIDIVTTKDFSPIIYTQLREFEVKDSI